VRNEDVAVIGMACRFPHANDLPALWRVISEGEVTFEPIDESRWKHSAFVDTKDVRAPDKTYVLKGAFVDDVDSFAALHYGLAPRRVQVMDPQQRLAIEATRQAFQDAGYDVRPFDRLNTGVFLGASVSEYRDLMTARHRAMQMANGEYGDALTDGEREAVRASVADVVPARAFSIAGGLLNMIACSVSQTFDLSGPAMQIDAACSSALVAIHEAVVNLRAGVCNVAVAGGVYLNLGPDNLIGFSRIGAISPSGACRPFDEKADGFVMGEGVGVVILKRLSDALHDGDRIYAVIKGSGCNNDGRGEGPMTPRPEGQKDAMRRAHQGLPFGVDSITYVETHGTATTVGDVVEVGALRDFFSERLPQAATAPYCWLGSIKANVGHTMSAAGVAGFIKTCLMMHHGVIPPQPGVEKINPKLDLPASPFKLASAALPWAPSMGAPKRAAVSSFGFGGTNAHVVLEEAPRATDRVQVSPITEGPQLIFLSAPSSALLAQSAASLAAHLVRHELSPVSVAAALAQRQAFDHRVAFVASTQRELVEQLTSIASALKAHTPVPTQVAFGTGPLPPELRSVAVLFAGQGAQKVGLLEGLVKRFGFFRERLFELDQAAHDVLGRSVIEALYPKDRSNLAACQAELTRTEVCQPAMAALGLALMESLERLGVSADVVLGHSLGEFAAAAAGGLLTAEQAVRLVAQRGQLMAQLSGPDHGAMLAVMAAPATVEPLLTSVEGVVIANHNHATQVVLSGTTRGIEAALAAVTRAGLKSARLDVSHAFHSPLMHGIDSGMAQLVEPLSLNAMKRPVVSCITGERYRSTEEAKHIWVRHATAPVRFVDALETTVKTGASFFIQAGAGSSLLAFARSVAEKAQGFFSLGSVEDPDDVTVFLKTLASLWVKGVPVTLEPLFERASMASLPPSLLETQRYWAIERTPRTPRAVEPPAPSRHAGARVSGSPVAPSFVAPSFVAQSTAISPLSVVPAPVQSTAFGDPLLASGASMNDVIALFQQQMQLLQSQAEILKAQSAAIVHMAGGSGLHASAMPDGLAQGPMTQQSVISQSAVGPAPQGPSALVAAPALKPQSEPVVAAKPVNLSNLVASKDSAGKPAASTAGEQGPSVRETVFGAVAKISAFPIASLRAEQTLVGELGFDSLMLVELDQAVGKAFPSLGGLPRELFGRSTTVGNIVDHLIKATSAAADGDPSEFASVAVEQAGPLERLLPTVVSVPLVTLTESVVRFERPILVTRDGRGVAEAVAVKLGQQGVAVALGEATTEGDFGGVIHCAELFSTADYRGGARTALKLAQRLTASKAELFVSVTGLGGGFGLSGATRGQLSQVGVLGFTQALAQEWTQAVVKAIDVDPTLAPEMIAAHLVDEVLSGDRTPEVGFQSRGRVAVSLVPSAAPARQALNASAVIIVTGGAKGVGLKLAQGLAKATSATLVLTGRAPASEEAAKACAQVKAAGARACSYQVMDVRDARAVASAVDAIRAMHGRIDGVVHAAGVVADALVERKALTQFDAVLETKVGGALALMDATARDALAFFGGVGSWAGRFGNAGQTDYSAANRMLARVSRPGVRCVTIDSPPWEDSEMVRKIPGFRKAELRASGVTFLQDEEGVAAFIAELLGGSGEVLLGRNVPSRTVSASAAFPVSRLNHVYLNDHTMSGQCVMPLAAAMDHLAGAALEVARGSKSAFAPFTVSDLVLERPVLVPDTTWLEVEVKGQIRSDGPAPLQVTLSQGSAPSYKGTVTPASVGEVPPFKSVAPSDRLPMSLETFYREFTFHGARLQGITRIDGLNDDGITGWVKGCAPADWVKEPLRTQWAVDPLLIDSSFQLAGYWAWAKHQRAGFPVGFERFVQLKPFGRGPVKCTVNFEASSDDVFSGTLVWHDEGGAVLAFMVGAKAEFKKRDPRFSSGKSTARASSPPRITSELAPAPVLAEAPLELASVTPSALDESAWNPAKFPEYEALQERLQMAEAFGFKNPYFSVHEAICGDTTVVDGKEMTNFSSYNYVGNSGDPVVSKAAQDAVAKYGTSVSASRVASGEKPLTRELERALADFFGTEDCIALVSGHATNVTVIGHIMSAGDLIVHDTLAHDSIIQGAKLSGAKRRPFAHNDFAALDRLLTSIRHQYRRVLICIEGTYSMDGDIPDLPAFIEVKKKHKALLLVDEAHSAGVLGKTGRGVGEYFNVNRADVDLWMGTLSKSFASCGGYIAGSHALVEYLKYTTPGFVYSVGLSPPNCAAALASTKQLLQHPERVAKLQSNAKYFLELLKARGINTGMSKDSAVVPAIIGNSVLCLQLSDALKNRGINVQPILYPAVEEDMARLRFFISSLHKPEQLLKAADILKEELDRLTREASGEAVA
jgi:8-amino-7-oxononanoate synthase